MKKYTKSNPLRIGTDCSGIEAPIQALQQLNIPYKHIWSSDTDKYCIQSIKANYNAEIIYGDDKGKYPNGNVLQRNNHSLPDIDLYVCGFPCQPFSHAGKRLGLQDVRGTVFYTCLDVIKIKKPTYFILENVKGILSNDKINRNDKYGQTWIKIWQEIEKLCDIGYYVDWKIINTKDYGIPQNRERVYIIGTLQGSYKWPEKSKMDDIKNYVDWNDTIKSKHKNWNNPKINDCFFVNVGFLNTNSHFKNMSPTLTTSSNQIWNVPLQRYANITEFLKLQGFNTNFKIVVSTTQTRKQLGNTMSVNVLKCILENF